MQRNYFVFLIIIGINFINGSFFTCFGQGMKDSVTSLESQRESYRLSELNLIDLAEKILYKKTPQEDLYLYILRPLNAKKKDLPAIIYFTGGGWINGNVAYQIPNAAWFRDHGIIGITADYRVKSRHGTSPLECIADAKSAVRFIRTNAKKLGINPNKIIVGGGSAGGHIAACTYIDGGDEPIENLEISSKPNALVLHNPVLGESFGQDFFNDHPEFSPLLKVDKGWPPTIISNGTNDKTTFFETAEKFTKLMKAAGNECELIPVEEAGHSCDWPVSNPNFLPTLIKMTHFLVQKKFIEKKKILYDNIAPDSEFPPTSYSPENVIEWSKNHYKEKINEFKFRPIPNNSIVMLGNSLTEGGGDWAKKLENISVVNRGISGDVTEGVFNRLGEICFYKPKAIFLMIGINDINGGNKSPHETFSNIQKIVGKIRTLSPTTKIYVQSLLPTIHLSLKPNILYINRKLFFDSKLNQFTYIDLFSGFADENEIMQLNFTSDGLHLNHEGYKVWVNLISRYIHKL